MKDLSVPSPPVAAAPQTAPAPPPPATSGPQGTAPLEPPAAPSAPPPPPTALPTAPFNPAPGVLGPAPTASTGQVHQPAAGTLEATLLRDMEHQPGLPPQWSQAFLELPPEEQRTMAQMYQAMPAANRPSFLVQPSTTRRSMAQMYGRMSEAQKQQFAQLPTNLQRGMAQLWGRMGDEQKTAFMALPPAEQQALGQLHEDGNDTTKAMLATLTPGEMHNMGEYYQRMTPADRQSFLTAAPGDQRLQANTFGQMNPAQKSAYLQMPAHSRQAMGQMFSSMTPEARTAFLSRSPAEQRQMAEAYEGLGAAAQTRFLTLPPDQQVQFGRVWAEAGRVDFTGTTSNGTDVRSPSEVRGALSRSLESGRLTEAGHDGKTALDHLDHLRTVPLSLPPGSNESIYRQQVFNTVVCQIDDPELIRQRNTGSCAATCPQKEYCRTRPADYAGFVVGLTSTEGRGRLPDGTYVTRSADALNPGVRAKPDGSPSTDLRTDVDRIVQSSMMNHDSPTGKYANQHDSHVIAGGNPTEGGLDLASVVRLHQAIRGVPLRGVEASSLAGATQRDKGHALAGVIAQDLQHQTTAGRSQPTVPVSLHWAPGHSDAVHAIEVTRVGDQRVYFRNPWGERFTVDGALPANIKQEEPPPAGNGLRYREVANPDHPPPRRIYEDNTCSVTRQFFDENVIDAVVT